MLRQDLDKKTVINLLQIHLTYYRTNVSKLLFDFYDFLNQHL